MNKKSMYMGPLFAVVVVIAIMYLAFVLHTKTSSFEKKIGEKQTELLNTYQKGEKALFYVDRAGKYSINKAIDEIDKGKIELGCGKYKDYALWKNKDNDCYPDLIFKKIIQEKLNEYLGKYIDNYKEAKIPKNNYEIYIKGKKIEAIAIKNILIEDEKNRINYSVKPSFFVNTNYNLMEKYKQYRETAEEALNFIITCLGEGSGEVNDDDLKTCTSKANVKLSDRIIATSYEDLDKEFYLFFDIVEEGKENIKFAVLLKDDIAPPKTTGIKIEKRDSKTYIGWDKNPASDTKIYEIYYKDIDFKKSDDANNLGQTSDTEIETSIKGDYYFAVIAKDEADNQISPFTTEKLTIS